MNEEISERTIKIIVITVVIIIIIGLFALNRWTDKIWKKRCNYYDLPNNCLSEEICKQKCKLSELEFFKVGESLRYWISLHKMRFSCLCRQDQNIVEIWVI